MLTVRAFQLVDSLRLGPIRYGRRNFRCDRCDPPHSNVEGRGGGGGGVVLNSPAAEGWWLSLGRLRAPSCPIGAEYMSLGDEVPAWSPDVVLHGEEKVCRLLGPSHATLASKK